MILLQNATAIAFTACVILKMWAIAFHSSNSTRSPIILLIIAERTNFMIRPPVANVDMIVIVASKAPPVTDIHFIDKIMVLAEHKNIEVAIVINKSDEIVKEKINTYAAKSA